MHIPNHTVAVNASSAKTPGRYLTETPIPVKTMSRVQMLAQTLHAHVPFETHIHAVRAKMDISHKPIPAIHSGLSGETCCHAVTQSHAHLSPLSPPQTIQPTLRGQQNKLAMRGVELNYNPDVLKLSSSTATPSPRRVGQL